MSLPYGWRAEFDFQSNRIYFVGNKELIEDQHGHSTWTDPRPLPPGWRVDFDPHYKQEYFIDPNGQSSWIDPRPSPIMTTNSQHIRHNPVSTTPRKPKKSFAKSMMDSFKGTLDQINKQIQKL